MGQRSDTKSFPVGITTPVEILPLRPEREVAWIFNVVGTLYFKLGKDCSDSSFTGRLLANEISSPIYKYSGPITVIKGGSGTTTVYVTECW